MEEPRNSQTEPESATLRERIKAKSPVQENGRNFEGKPKSPVEFEEKSQTSETSRSQPQNQRPDTLIIPTENSSLGFLCPIRSKSPGNYAPTVNESPSGSSIGTFESTITNGERSKSPETKTGGSKSPGVTNESMSYSGWTKESPVIAESSQDSDGTPDEENLSKVGDNIDSSCSFDNIDYIADSKADKAISPAAEDVWPKAESPVDENDSAQLEQRFRNSLEYNITAWNDETWQEDSPQKPDEFIQRLCDQVRNHVEYLCGMNFINYEAISYKVRVAGSKGIFYYVKVKVCQKYYLHLRIFCHRNELTAIPALQAILERDKPDNGNIEVF